MNRTRLLLVIALVVIIIGAVVAFVLVGQPAPTGGGGDTGGSGNTSRPASTEVVNTPTPLPPTPTPIEFVDIVVAVQDIPRGIRITPDALAIRPVPAQSAPFQAFTNPQEVQGLIARTDIGREQPVLQNLVVPDLTNLANVGSDAAAVLPSTRVAIAVPMDRLTSIAYAIQPGDRVDVIVSMLFIDVDQNYQSIEPNTLIPLAVGGGEDGGGEEGTGALTAGAPLQGDAFDTLRIPLPNGSVLPVPVIVQPSEGQRPRLTTQRTIQDALVIWTGDFPVNGRIFRPAATVTPTPNPEAEDENADGEPQPTPVPPRPDIVTLAVSPQDAVVLTWMIEAGLPITFALRSASSTSLVQTDPVTLDYILNRFRITIPDKFDYNIQPAIRSIRELSIGNQISLGN